MKGSYKRKAIQYSGLRRLVKGLREIASGETVEKALGRMEKYVEGRIKGELARHVYTGLALRTVRVQLTGKAIEIKVQTYRKYIPWSWKKGVPIGVIKRCQKIIKEELQLAVKGGAS